MLYLALILMLMIGVSKGMCPNMCECRYYPRDDLPKTSFYFTSVSCNVYQPNTIRELDNTTRQFRISNVNKTQLLSVIKCLKDHKSSLPILTDLTISKSELNYANETIQGLEWIQSLTLTDNKLTVLPQLFLNLPTLKDIDLSQNTFENIDDSFFWIFQSLESLNLSVNAISNISNKGFLGLENLKCLDLSRNELTSISKLVLAPLQSLQYLNLSSNQLEVLDETCFSQLTALQQLDISWNQLSRIAPGSLELPSLTRLLLAGNVKLGSSRDSAVLVGTGRKLQIVDASRTGLKQVPAALTHSIRSLRLAGNNIRSVSCGDLDSYPLLQLLDLASNDLITLEEDALGRLDSLAVLYLSDNNIQEIPRSLPEKLKALHVEHNNVEKVSEKDLHGLVVLEVLLLNDNKISVIEQGAFSHLQSLATLDLSRNPVIVLQPGSLTGPFALQVLRLSSMRIISPAEENSFPLSTPDDLITLDLSDSPGLARQLLADTATLVASKQLQELDLSGTNLEYIRSDLLHFLPQLRYLHIRRNRLNCTQLHWLGAWLRRQDTLEYRDVVCSSPPDLWGVPLVDIQETEGSTDDSIMVTELNFIHKQLSSMLKVQKPFVFEKGNKNITKKVVVEDLHFENELFKNKSILTSTSISFEAKQALTALFQGSESLGDDENGFNETGKVAITETLNPFKQTTVMTAQNANETPESASNRPSPSDSSFISKFSRDLLIARDEKSFNKSSEESVESGSMVTSPQWDGKMSMYTNNKKNGNFVHPGMLILAVGVVAAGAVFLVLAVRFVRNKKVYREEDIEVAISLPTVTDLW
ncbi:uncharacterized protein [Leptinotarsa decemlineata]|uniref:uncharacterized protein n=1 Tax=Leptinotarsa decemlineata TaxID=7539 RepID=UPI003D30D2B5